MTFYSRARRRAAAFYALLFVLLVVIGMIAAVPFAHGQMLDAVQFPGNDQGSKVTAAQAACNSALTCVIVLKPELGSFATGTMPSKCASCTWLDYRTPNVELSYAGSYWNSNANSSIGSQTLYTAPVGGGRYVIYYYLSQRTVCSSGSGTLTATFGWNDGPANRSVTTISVPIDTTNSTSEFAQGVLPFRTTAGSPINITASTTYTAGTCVGATYTFDVYVERKPL